MKIIKIAIVQTNPVYGEKEKNKKEILRFISKAAKENCDIVLFPELCNTGYLIKKEDRENLGETLNGDFVTSLKISCEENKIHVIAGYLETNENRDNYYNSAVFLDNRGNILYNYRKNFLWKKEKILFESGDEYKVIKCDLGNIGVLICYDIEFPEPARKLGLYGADIVFVPSCFSKIAENRWDVCVNANALFNLFFVVGANVVDKYCCGKSKVVSPNGVTIIEAKSDQTDFIIAEIDIDEVRTIREKIPYYKDLKL